MTEKALDLYNVVRAALEQAIASSAPVEVTLAADPARRLLSRTVEGVPLCFLPMADGRDRVVISVAEGATEQLVRVDRIAQVSFKPRE